MHFLAVETIADGILATHPDAISRQTRATWKKTRDTAEEYRARCITSLASLANDVKFEKLASYLDALDYIRSSQGAWAAKAHARGFVEQLYLYPRFVLPTLMDAAEGRHHDQ